MLMRLNFSLDKTGEMKIVAEVFAQLSYGLTHIQQSDAQVYFLRFF